MSNPAEEQQERQEEKENNEENLNVRLIHGLKKKPRTFTTKTTLQEIRESITKIYPSINEMKEWHLEFDNGCFGVFFCFCAFFFTNYSFFIKKKKKKKRNMD